MMFLERLVSTGMKGSKYWYDLTWNWFAKDDLWLPNCTNFACGRSSEVCGKNVKAYIPRGNAQTWYADSKWVGSKKPKVGAIAVFSGGTYGHVAIVERVLDSSGKVILSQSNWNRGSAAQQNANYFQLVTCTPVVGKVTSEIKLKFLGYLLNPYVTDKRVARDTSKWQVEVTMEKVRARKAANGEAYSGLFIPMGIYNILEESGDWLKIDEDIWFSKGNWARVYTPEQTEPSSNGLIKFVKDPAYDYRWSLDGNKYGDKYDITSMNGFSDAKLVEEGWEEILAVNGSLFYTYDNMHYALGVEKSRGVNNQELDMSAVTDCNEVMAIGMGYTGSLIFAKTRDICGNLSQFYGAVTGEFGIMLEGKKTEWGKDYFATQYNDISGRTVIGEDKDGNPMSFSVAGITGKTGYRGKELYDICKEMGFYNAICFDGGGSVFRRVFGKVDISTTRKVKNCVLLYRKKKAVTEEPPVVTPVEPDTEAVKKELDRLKKELSTANKDISEYKSKLDTALGTNASLQHELDEKQVYIGALTSDYNDLKCEYERKATKLVDAEQTLSSLKKIYEMMKGIFE